LYFSYLLQCRQKKKQKKKAKKSKSTENDKGWFGICLML
jgi:hypothetical protein